LSAEVLRRADERDFLWRIGRQGWLADKRHSCRECGSDQNAWYRRPDRTG
jgi:hypothetical protein